MRALLGALALLLALAPSPAPAQDAPIQVNATPIERFDVTGIARIGSLEFRGGLVLSSPADDFGGLSSLLLDADGEHFLAASDRGSWLSGRIVSEGDRPTGIVDARLGPMRVAGGGTLAGRGRADVESLVRIKGGILAGIERKQEVWIFPGADPLKTGGRRLLTDPALDALGNNESLEAMIAPPDGQPAPLIVIAEESPDDPAIMPGFLFGPLKKPALTGRFTVRRRDDFCATDAALSDDGMVYLLERRFDLLRGVAMRIRRFPLGDIKPGAVIEGEVLVTASRVAAIDNMEALALHRNAAGELILTVISDDNFSALQRTLLLRFAVVEKD